MGYDMQSKEVEGDAGYFRLNIWGMGWMRDIMAQADPELGDEHIMKKFCSNDGWLVGKTLGKKIAKALRAFAVKGKTYTVSSLAFSEKEIPPGACNIRKEGSIISYTLSKEMSDEDIELILNFATYNENCTPYEVF